MRSIGLLMIALALTLFASAWARDEEGCGKVPLNSIAGGSYYTTSDHNGAVTGTQTPSTANDDPKVLTVDRDAGIATVRYRHEGKVIVERWAFEPAEGQR